MIYNDLTTTNYHWCAGYEEGCNQANFNIKCNAINGCYIAMSYHGVILIQVNHFDLRYDNYTSFAGSSTKYLKYLVLTNNGIGDDYDDLLGPVYARYTGESNLYRLRIQYKISDIGTLSLFAFTQVYSITLDWATWDYS